MLSFPDHAPVLRLGRTVQQCAAVASGIFLLTTSEQLLRDLGCFYDIYDEDQFIFCKQGGHNRANISNTLGNMCNFCFTCLTLRAHSCNPSPSFPTFFCCPVCRWENNQAEEQLKRLQGVAAEKKKAEESARKVKAEADEAVAGAFSGRQSKADPHDVQTDEYMYGAMTVLE